MRRLVSTITIVLLFGFPAVIAAQPSARAKANIAVLEKALPAAEKATDAFDKDLQKFDGSREPNVIAAVEGARLRLDAIRSVRTIIDQQPDFFAWRLGEASLRQWVAGIEYFLDCARTRSDPFRGKTSGIRTLRSPIDGQVLFYVFKLPKDYDAAKRYPMDVSLHSGAALTWRAGWIDGAPSDDPRKAAADERIWISPCGRGNNSYAGMGEVAVMDAIADAVRHYAVDPDRVTIGGASMGGTGGFRLAALHPDQFAAAHSLTGGANYAVPVNDGRYDATLLVDNFANTPLCIWDAPKEGWFKQNRAFADGLRDRAQSRSGSYPVLELTDPVGGHGIIDGKLRAEGWEWLKKQRRNPSPQRVIYKTYSLRYDGAYWARIETVTDAARPARIEAEIEMGGKVRIAVENVERFRLDLTRVLLGTSESATVSINAAAPATCKVAAVHFARAGDQWNAVTPLDPNVLVKRHGLSGPIQDAFLDGPVLWVHGVSGVKSIHAAVMSLFGPGDGGALLHTGFERKADRDVTPEDIAAKHLVLVGTPRANSILSKIAGQLPVKFLDDGIELAGKSYRGDGVGLTMVYPNPLNRRHYILLIPEDYAGGSPLGLPDFVVGRRIMEGKRTSYLTLARGSFDASWRLAK
jgi:pimeloyl-ACP methyl ester carboxylesterase